MRDRHDPLEAVRSLASVDRHRLAESWSHSEAKKALFKEITMRQANAPTKAGSRVPLSRRAVVLAATVATLGLATIGWAVVKDGDATLTTGVACHGPSNGVSVIDGTSGDPVADCQSHWAELTGGAAPPMTAYHNGAGGIEVLTADQDVPQGWEQLAPGVVQDPAVLGLESALDDGTTGLRSDCLTAGPAREIVTAELARLKLTDWSVATERGEADGVDTCTYFVIRPAEREVALVPIEGLVDAS